MDQNKINFISNLLTNKKISLEDREKIFVLATKEIYKMDNTSETLLSNVLLRIEQLEKRDLENVSVRDAARKHDAPSLVRLLKTFTLNEKSLKYTTHSWEYGKFESYDDFKAKIANEWNAIKLEIKNLNSRLAAKISNFLFNDNLGDKYQWGESYLKFGWSSPALVQFMKDQYDPFMCPIPNSVKEKERIGGLLYFRDYVSIFKNEIEIREDSNALETIFFDLWESEVGYDFNVIMDDSIKGVSFFTDVPYLKATLRLIFKNFKTRPQYPNISVKIVSNFKEKYLILKITQDNSICLRDVNDPKILEVSGGDFGTIIKNLENLADFSILSEFKNKEKYRINYLVSQDNVSRIETIENISGFTYELKFYL